MNKKSSPDMHELRENVLRPWPTLGYDRDSLALHLMERGAFPIAESQFRRAAWLNPYEPKFKAHLAECLWRQGKLAEARALMSDLPEDLRTGELQKLLCHTEEDSKAKDVTEPL